MGPSAGYDGNVPADQGRARLVHELSSLVRDWEGALAAGPGAAGVAKLCERSAPLEQASRAVGFGGVGHHLAELRRLASSAATPEALRAQLEVVRELVEHARQALSPAEHAEAAPPSAADGLAPPPLLTQFRRDAGGESPLGAGGPAPPLAPPSLGGAPAGSLQGASKPLAGPSLGSAPAGSVPLTPPPLVPLANAPGGNAPGGNAPGGNAPGGNAPVGSPPPLAPLPLANPSGGNPPPPLAPLPLANAPAGNAPPLAPLPVSNAPGGNPPLGSPPLAPLPVANAPAGNAPPPLAPLPLANPSGGNAPPPLAPLPLANPSGGNAPAGSPPPLAPLPLGPAPLAAPPLAASPAGPLAPPPLAPLPHSPAEGPPRSPAPAEKQPFAASPPVLRNFTAAEGPSPVAERPSSAAPKLLVRSMLGLRAFGRGSGPAPSPGEARAAPAGPSLLGLKRGSGSGPVPQQAAPAPEREAALPPLAGALPETPGAGPAPPPRLDQILNKIEDARDRRPSRSPASLRARVSRRPEQPGTPWWVPALIAGGFLTAVGIIVGVTVVVARGDRAGATASDTSGSAAPSASGSVAAGVSLPRQRLLRDEEQFQELLQQLHGRGKESPELAALLDEQAAVAARAIGPEKCVGTPGECAALAEVRELVTGDTPTRVVRRRSSSSDGWRSKWLAGLKMPGIPVEDDPRVQRRFEFYTQNPVGREVFQQMLWRCGEYSELIRAALIRRGLPEDLLAVVFAESGCQPLAKSPAGAEGLWQFIPAAARSYHLRVIEGVVDERHSPVKATEAAVHYLSDLYAKMGHWDLAMAGYNMGPFGLLARIQRAGGNVGFWDLVDSDLLPDETADYVPNIEAIALILANLSRLKFGGIQTKAPQLTADLQVPPGTRLGLVARAAAMSTAGLRQLNLDIKGDRTPDLPGFMVQVPKDVVWRAGETLQELLRAGDNADQCVPPNFDWGRQRFTAEMAASCQRRLAAAAPVSGSAPNAE